MLVVLAKSSDFASVLEFCNKTYVFILKFSILFNKYKKDLLFLFH